MRTHVTRHAPLAAAALLAVVAGAPRDSGACGAFFSSSSETSVVDMSNQRVLLVYSDEGRVDHYVQVSYEGNPSTFAWVYPLAANPDIDEGDENIFTRLDDLTKPRFTITTKEDDDGGGCGCFPFAGSAGDSKRGAQDAGADGSPPVTVWNQGKVGIFDYAVITATTIADMLGWLTDNGFNAPEKANAVLQHYVDLGWFFVAMKIDPEEGQRGARTSVIRFTYPYSAMAYPLYMTSISPTAAVGITIYLVASRRMETTGDYRTLAVDRDDVKAVSSTSTNYDTLFAGAIAGAGGKAFVVEYAGSGYASFVEELDLAPVSVDRTTWLTRLRTSMQPVNLSADVQFKRAGESTAVSRDFSLEYDPGSSEGASSAPLLLGLLAAGGIMALRSLLRRRG